MIATQDIELSHARSQARALLASGQLIDACTLLVRALGQTYALEEEYVPLLAMLSQVFLQLGQPRRALTCCWYLNETRVAASIIDQVPPHDRARTYLAQALRRAPHDPGRRSLFSRAAAQFEAAGLIAHAAVYRETAEEHDVARALWSRLCQTVGREHEGDLYAAALASFNLARTSRKTGDERAARDATVAAVHLLEEAADRYESIGQRERAFDCYQVLAAVGRDSKTVEHVLEGSVNLIRILREDQLRSFALREYEDATRFLREQGEVAAAATVAREMGEYAQHEGQLAVANHAMLTQAEMWRQLAHTTVERGGPVEIAENALLAAVMSYAELGQFRRAGQVYVELAHLPLEAGRRAHYARASARYQGARDVALEPNRHADSPRAPTSVPNVWHVDLIEWEQRGSAVDVCGDIVIDVHTWSEVICRRALLARLHALALEAEPGAGSGPQGLERLAEALAPTELYVVLSPLEKLYENPDAAVRAAVVRALGRFLYKRTFITLRRALNDVDSTVRGEACRAIEQLHFPHAFDPLARVFRESSDWTSRAAALRALALVDTDEAAEMVMDVLRHAGPSERAHVISSLLGSCGARLIRLANEELARASGDLHSSLRELLRAPGMRG